MQDNFRVSWCILSSNLCLTHITIQSLIVKFSVKCVHFQRSYLLRECRLPPLCKRDPRSSGISHSIEMQFLADVSGQPIPWKVEQICCPETSAKNYHSIQRSEVLNLLLLRIFNHFKRISELSYTMPNSTQSIPTQRKLKIKQRE